ncbi:MAG: mannose-1-phosphate guanylyltransferase/mannose-6-phosphate isomerase [Bdellovibrionaceae bacterium]|nr:mannose-1-phosphate guanylyltransferase/mannose-6-phosphate isomerase [Pseudobdellovibrionaceae bacterium]
MIPVILSGGSGTRLWPVSRASYPKQFCEFYDQSFLKNSIQRLKPFGSPYILTLESMKPLSIRSLAEEGLGPDFVIAEPMGKNTAPAVALLCHWLRGQGKQDEVVGIFPADHLIADEQAFRSAVELGIECAEAGEVVTLGITPSHASTGYGYIEVKDDVAHSAHGLKAYGVEGFREKPDEKTARTFLDSGKHYWNAGMFVFKVSTMIAHFQELLPEVWKKISAIKPDLSNAKYNYAMTDSVSLDYGIMEKLTKQVCIPCTIGWSDVGSWDELSRLSEEISSLKTDSNASVFSEDALHNYVFTIRDKVIGLIGVENLIVVDTPDALLVCKKGKSQKVKDLLDQIKKAGLPEATEHRFEVRPWGGFEVLSDQKHFKVKRITVDPGAKLSYQSHAKRAEHWVVVEGEAEIVLDDKAKKVNAGEAFYIPLGAKHRIGNVGTGPMVFVEVQTGSYFGEDDIVRYQDDYSRA